MFTQKIHRHDVNWENTPPSAGPTTEATAHTPAM